jgi:hypothetical protein
MDLSSFNDFPRRAPAGGPAGMNLKNEKIKFPNKKMNLKNKIFRNAEKIF